VENKKTCYKQVQKRGVLSRVGGRDKRRGEVGRIGPQNQTTNVEGGGRGLTRFGKSDSKKASKIWQSKPPSKVGEEIGKRAKKEGHRRSSSKNS